ncbi:hypothetical protein CIW83_09535 [Tissierella sp. P1]|uniref:hypothetical protein n=1 Tax=Tissierella sp. P1 TaxID=1280483 RepID=UPI000BA06C57|nr:hypothetical protein [Tissierella sp. P1]OZV12328.1 hypothetical protein CIW83_09535 [Tissierella sp. P1]
MYKWISDIMGNQIAIDLVIGFFYSAIIGLTILGLTYLLDKKESLKNLSIDLTKLVFVLNSINESVNRISRLDGAKYRKFFGDVLDQKEIEQEEIKTVSEFIIYDRISYLPPLNNYLVEKFNITNKEFKGNEEELLRLLQSSTKDKESFLVESNIFIISYEDINRRINRINDKLDYYRELTYIIIGFNSDDLERDNIATGNILRVFKMCIDTIISECKELKELLMPLENLVNNNLKELDEKIEKNNKNQKFVTKGFIVLIIICLVLLLIA